MRQPDEGKAMGTNVIDFTARRESSAPRPLREVEAYWDLLRDGRLVPDRSEVDPRGFPGALSHSFLLERIAPGLARVRITGRHLSDLMGIDMQGLPFTSLFLPEARPAIIEVMSAVFEEPAVARLRLESAGGIGRRRMEARLLLMPLRDDQGEVTRAIGALVAEGPIGRTPRRFSVLDRQCQTLIGFGRRKATAAPHPGPHPVPAPDTPGGTVVTLRPRD
jgi:hypothetical protein